jgi:hypothetical protein
MHGLLQHNLLSASKLYINITFLVGELVHN